jgi:hypothetical protein
LSEDDIISETTGPQVLDVCQNNERAFRGSGVK